MELAGQLAQVVGNGMRFILSGGAGYDFGVLVQTVQQRFFVLFDQPVQMG